MFRPITLQGALLVPLREAMLSRVRRRSTDLADALAAADWEEKLDAQEAYQDLRDAGVMLDRLGWHHELPEELVLEEPSQARFAVQALSELLSDEADEANLARESGEHERAVGVERSWQEVHSTLWQLEAALAGAPPGSDTSHGTDSGTREVKPA
ncbi:MAG: hypothetical protein ACYCPS_04765 [Candidatus Saccharimonadales bacterium]